MGSSILSIMKLKRFRVTNFRSVDDSGWINVDDVTALIGTNESGKTNILLPLWKLNPAKEGAIIPTADYPRKQYNEIRQQKPKPIFIRAVFDVGDEFAQELGKLTGVPSSSIREIEVARRFDSQYVIDFPEVTPERSVHLKQVQELLESAHTDISAIEAMKTETRYQVSILECLSSAQDLLSLESTIDSEGLEKILEVLEAVDTKDAPKTGSVVPRFQEASDNLQELLEGISRPHPRDLDGVADLIISRLPKFVYYSTYGNLDSEIYLPHVIANLSRKDLGLKEQAKARTLKVLFEFVRLQPQEILELGRDFKNQNREPTDEEISAIAEKKKEREILLQSASAKLTREFRDWWKQGQYRFRFNADGDHFRIWVSDDRRPDEIELEGRSTGLQWFLSFYLVFLVEQVDAHEGAILLLDEPGLSLHPLAQRDLSEFFDGLAKDNQLLYTCHSPFLVDADRLDRARKVYVAEDGSSKVTEDLRAPAEDKAQLGAAYAAYSAIGLSVAESILLGCTPIVVEGPSDQHYLTAIKNLLIAAGLLKPGRELVFPPGGGSKGVKAVAGILTGRDEDLPIALFDGDSNGKITVEALRKGLYVDAPEKVLQIDSFSGIGNSEVEDLIPQQIIAHQLDRWQRTSEVPFADIVKPGIPIVPQIEAWAKTNGVELPNPGWKVELSKRVKKQLLSNGLDVIEEKYQEMWIKLFDSFKGNDS